MKATRFTTLIAIGFALSFFAAGCKSPQNVTNIPGRHQHPEDISGAGMISGTLPGTNLDNMMTPLNPTNMHSGWIEDPSQFKEQTIHFAFDSSAVRSEEKS